MYAESKNDPVSQTILALCVTHSFSAAMAISKTVILMFVNDHTFELQIGILFLKVPTFLTAAVFMLTAERASLRYYLDTPALEQKGTAMKFDE